MPKFATVPKPLEWKKNQKVSISFLNQLLALCKENRVNVDPPLRMRTGVDTGTQIGLDPQKAQLWTIFPVLLTKTSGDPGDASTYCSFVYTVKSVTDYKELATGIAPANSRARIAKGPCTEAQFGSAYYDKSGGIILWDADETHDTGTC